MITDVESAAGGAALGASRGIKGTRAGKGAKDAERVQIGDERTSAVKQMQDFGRGRLAFSRILHACGRGAQDGYGAVRHEDIAVRTLVQAVDDPARETLVENDERALVGCDGYIQSDEAGHLAAPGTGRVNHDTAGHVVFFARGPVEHVNARHPAVGRGDPCHGMVGQSFAAIAAGTHDVLLHEAEAIDGPVRNTEHALHVRSQIRLHAFRFGRIDFDSIDTCPAAAFNPLLYIGRIVLFREDEKAARVLHAALSDALEDDIFPDALGGGLVVTHGIAGAAVQEPVEPGTGSVCDAPHFEEQGPDTAHGKIPQDTRAGGAPADNDDCGFLHTLLQICHVKDIVMSHP